MPGSGGGKTPLSSFCGPGDIERTRSGGRRQPRRGDVFPRRHAEGRRAGHEGRRVRHEGRRSALCCVVRRLTGRDARKTAAFSRGKRFGCRETSGSCQGMSGAARGAGVGVRTKKRGRILKKDGPLLKIHDVLRPRRVLRNPCGSRKRAEAEVSCGQALPVPLKPFSGRAANAEHRGNAAVFLRLRYFFGALSRDWAFSFTQ